MATEDFQGHTPPRTRNTTDRNATLGHLGRGPGSSDIPRCAPADTRITVRPDDAAFQARLAAARAGDDVAWVELYHELAPLIIGYLRAQRLPDAEDVAGEVLLETVRDLDRFRGDAANLRSWVLSIAHHRLLDARRQQARRPAGSSPVEEATEAVASDDPEGETLAALGFGRLEPALAELTEEQRTVLLLRVIGDLPIAEVARITGKRPGAVKQLQRRASEAMRRHLDAAAADDAAAAEDDRHRPPSDRLPPAPARRDADTARDERTSGPAPVSSSRPHTLIRRDGRHDAG